MSAEKGRRTIRGIQIAQGKAKKAQERKLDKDRKFRSKDSILRHLYNILIRPIIDKKPENYDKSDWLEEVWAIDDHPIKSYKVKKVFNIPSNDPTSYCEEVFIKKEFKSVKDTIAWVRFNKKESVDLEIKTNLKNHLVFNLSYMQWHEIEHNFKEIQ